MRRALLFVAIVAALAVIGAGLLVLALACALSPLLFGWPACIMYALALGVWWAGGFWTLERLNTAYGR